MSQKTSSNEPSVKPKNATPTDVRWLLPDEKPLRFTGFNWFEKERIYRRFPSDELRYPANARTEAGNGAVNLSWHSAGVQTAFRCDSSKILIKAVMGESGWMDHMTQVGSSGFDLYTDCIDGELQLVGASRYPIFDTQFNSTMRDGLTRKMRNFLIHWPLYHQVKEVFIGVDADSKFEPPRPWSDPRPVVVYGTSITQGGCATRPGMSYPNILSRMLNMPFLNFGFSGSGKGEPEVAEMICDVQNPALFIIDYEANAQLPEKYESTLPIFLDIVRKHHPKTPIMVMTSIPYGRDYLQYITYSSLVRREKYLNVSLLEVARRRVAGDRNIHFFDGKNLMGNDWDECSVDTVHPTDLGFYRMAKGLFSTVEKLVGYQGGQS